MGVHGKILIVDDDEPTLEFFKAILEAEGYVVVQARDGVEALERFDTFDPDVVLLDLMLPRLNGFEICSRIRRNARSCQVPIIMLSGLADHDTKVRAMENGVNEFLAKPVERVELVSRVRAALNLRFCTQCRADHESKLATARQQLQDVRHSLTVAQQHSAPGADSEIATLLGRLATACDRLGQILG